MSPSEALGSPCPTCHKPVARPSEAYVFEGSVEIALVRDTAKGVRRDPGEVKVVKAWSCVDCAPTFAAFIEAAVTGRSFPKV